DMYHRFGQCFRRGLSSAVAWSFLGTALRVGSGILLLPLLLRSLPKEQLGLWYVFISLGGLIGLLDMGFAPTASRAIAYLWAGAQELLPHGVQAVPEEHKGKPNRQLLINLLAPL